MLMPYLCIETLLVGMIEHLSHALLIILSNVLTRKILIFCEFSACISIYNAVYFPQRLRSRSLSLSTRVGTGTPARAALTLTINSYEHEENNHYSSRIEQYFHGCRTGFGLGSGL